MSTKQSTASCFLWLENVRQYIILICCLICFDSTQSIVTRHFCNKTFKLMKVLRVCLIWSLWLELFKLLDCRYIFKMITKNMQISIASHHIIGVYHIVWDTDYSSNRILERFIYSICVLNICKRCKVIYIFAICMYIVCIYKHFFENIHILWHEWIEMAYICNVLSIHAVDCHLTRI